MTKKTEEKKKGNGDMQIIKYETRSGQEITLSYDSILKYLVHGKSELVTVQELVTFMAICKARQLDPYAKDCYLIKYSEKDPASIIISIDYYRSRARVQADCQGWNAGIIVQDSAGNVNKTKGLLLKGQTLLGGWFKAKPKGWEEPFELEVNLAGYIKKTVDGKITAFWKEEKQPTMIRKVAEAQGLRELWPNEFQGLYLEEEVRPSPDDINMKEGEDYSVIDKKKVEAFDESLVAILKNTSLPNGIDLVKEYISRCAEHFGTSVEQFKMNVVDENNFEEFWKHFLDSLDKPENEQEEAPEKGEGDNKGDTKKNDPDADFESQYRQYAEILDNTEIDKILLKYKVKAVKDIPPIYRVEFLKALGEAVDLKAQG